ncbi:hypothetical protein AGMMS49975_12050 [Clostridia bacterium]|nr:hypothetical protein AGMMS49975_12050 [Clostridia bacterium]
MKSESLEISANTMFTPKKAISYIRVSSRGQAERGGGDNEGFSIPAQREAIRKRAASLGAFIVKEFVDRGTSAKSADRKELQEMLKYITENKVEFVIIHKVDRLARNRGDDVDIMRRFSEHGVKLISTSESIDETPAGMLLHGIMASIAEFYSLNLATEVVKGMTTKAKSGGTISKAPLGYKNIRRLDKMGREERLVVLDEERAPLMRLAFEQYATGEWTVSDLAEHLALRGLTTRPTLKLPSKPIDGKALNKALVNPYYKGVVRFADNYYPGRHQPLTEETTWQRVQDILSSHLNGERTRKHPHFLKGTIFCGSCGERLIIQYAKSRSGIRYPYFTCAGRHSRRTKCKQKALLIESVEKEIEKLYYKITLEPTYRAKLEKWIISEMQRVSSKGEDEQRKLKIEMEKIDRKQRKLLEAHYADAIPLDLFKEEQEKLTSAAKTIERQINAGTDCYALFEKNLNRVLSLLENCGKLYINAPDFIKRCFNQAFFEKVYVSDNGENSINISSVFEKPYSLLFDGQASIYENRNRNPLNFFRHGFNNDLMVALSDTDLNNYSKLLEYRQEAIQHPNYTTLNPENPAVYIDEYGQTAKSKVSQYQKRLSITDITRIIKEYQDGMTTYALAAKYGCHYNTISRNLKKHGVMVSRKKIKTEAEEEEVVRLYKSGLTIEQVAKQLGAGNTTILRCLHRHGVGGRR